jgi:cytochrome b subunit of formate dehydrogenase
MSQEQKYYRRFSVAQRVEHWVMFASFTLLAITGIPQKFVGMAWAESMIAVFGGIEQTRIIHRWAAILILTVSVSHLLGVAYKVYVKRVQMSMLPGVQDMTDMLAVLSYNLGLRKDRPKMPRYNYAEKMEYWAFVWGTALMAVTGFMLWNPIATAKFMPGSFIPAAKAAHGGEALLAVLAVIVWHFYWVHLRQFNRSMFTGNLSAEEMAHEHALELEQIESGDIPPPAPADEVAKRTRIFVPVAVIISLAFIYGLYLFATFEDTAPSEALAAAVESPGESFQPITLPAGVTVHTTLEEYTDPTSCTASGCHNAYPLETATESAHHQRIAAAGPNPLLAKLAADDVPAGENTSECLVCHASELQADDLLASARTVSQAGGETCTRCHSGHPENDVHTEVGLACVSCHTSTNHEIQTEVACGQCHAEKPHADPFLNTKHERLDCRTCHVSGGVAMTVDTGQATQSPVTGFFEPTVTEESDRPHFAWLKDGQEASIDTEGAMIAPVIPVTVLASSDFDPAAYALDGQADGQAQETKVTVVPSHGMMRGQARTCASCHGPESDFDFAGLGYGQQADSLSAKPAVETE